MFKQEYKEKSIWLDTISGILACASIFIIGGILISIHNEFHGTENERMEPVFIILGGAFLFLILVAIFSGAVYDVADAISTLKQRFSKRFRLTYKFNQ